MYPFLQTLFADAGYQGPQFHNALRTILPHVETQIVKSLPVGRGNPGVRLDRANLLSVAAGRAVSAS
jgi:hypothetical protein